MTSYVKKKKKFLSLTAKQNSAHTKTTNGFFESIKENLKFMVVHWGAIFQENSSKQKADT